MICSSTYLLDLFDLFDQTSQLDLLDRVGIFSPFDGTD